MKRSKKTARFAALGTGSRKTDFAEVCESGTGAPLADVFCQTWCPTTSTMPHLYRIRESEVGNLMAHLTLLERIQAQEAVGIDAEDTPVMCRLYRDEMDQSRAEGCLFFTIKSPIWTATYIAIKEGVELDEDCVSLIESLTKTHQRMASILGFPTPSCALDDLSPSCKEPRFLAFLTPKLSAIESPNAAKCQIARMGHTAFWTAAAFFAGEQVAMQDAIHDPFE